jgi:hypothetical protein
MIERIWRQRRRYADLLVAPDRVGSVRKTMIVRLEAARRQAEAAVRRSRKLVRKR